MLIKGKLKHWWPFNYFVYIQITCDRRRCRWGFERDIKRRPYFDKVLLSRGDRVSLKMLVGGMERSDFAVFQYPPVGPMFYVLLCSVFLKNLTFRFFCYCFVNPFFPEFWKRNLPSMKLNVSILLIRDVEKTKIENKMVNRVVPK